MKNIHKISIGVTFVGFFFVIATVHADTGHMGRSSLTLPKSISVVVTAVSDNDQTIYVQTGSTDAITSYTIETGNAKTLKSGIASSVSSIQINDNILAIGAVSDTNITAKIIIYGFLPLVRGPPTA